MSLTEEQMANIPQELKDRPQWVAWTLKDRGGLKADKIPINVHTGEYGASNKPATWGTFEQAIDCAKKHTLPGIGFVFTQEDEFTGIDFDDCLDIEKDQIATGVKEWLDKFKSYSEVSPSLNGIKAIIKGSVVRGQAGKICEIYPYGRFFTITGNRLPQYPTHIRHCNEELQELYKLNSENAVDPITNMRPYGWQDEVLHGVSAGQRHGTALALAGRWIQKGLSPDEIGLFVAAWNQRNEPPKDTLSNPESKETQDIITYVIQKQNEQVLAEVEPGGYELAKSKFPRKTFPWEVLPNALAKSLQQLARSVGTSPISLPGVAVAILSSVLGSTFNAYPTASWAEPLVFWVGDIRESGEGKTPAARKLTEVIEAMQREANKVYEEEMDYWEALDKDDRGPKPKLPRGYFVTDLTLEGLRKDHSWHGGKVCILDELSAFINSQNQYKGGKGSDRESWISLHDAKPARSARASGAITIDGARISIFGGVQPSVWRKVFAESDRGLYTADGTIFRFLLTIEGEVCIPMTGSSWGDESKKIWEDVIKRAAAWADEEFEQQKGNGANGIFLFEDAAREYFIRWRNRLFNLKRQLPPKIKGFVPKIVGAGARFAGALHCIHRFSIGENPGPMITKGDVRRGLKVAEFYLGHAIVAVEAYNSEFDLLRPFAQQILGAILELKDEIRDGRLPTKMVAKTINPDPNIALLTKIGMTASKELKLATGKTPDGNLRCLLFGPHDLDRLRSLHESRGEMKIPELFMAEGISDTSDTSDTSTKVENMNTDQRVLPDDTFKVSEVSDTDSNDIASKSSPEQKVIFEEY